jgi:hypothetical protein
MVLSTPFRGRSLPFSFVVYSSKTIGAQITSRNQEHFRCFEAVKRLLGDRPLVLDREFSYEELMEILYIEQIQFVIRLNLGDQHKQPRLIDTDGEPVKLFIKPGETIIRPNLYYLGTVKVNLIGYWRKSLSKPLWIMTTLEPKRGLEIYLKRMKIEETFRDCKDLLHLTKLMNKKQPLLEQMITLCLLAYIVGVWLGKAIRDVVYGKLNVSQVPDALLNACTHFHTLNGLLSAVVGPQQVLLPIKQAIAVPMFTQPALVCHCRVPRDRVEPVHPLASNAPGLPPGRAAAGAGAVPHLRERSRRAGAEPAPEDEGSPIV